MHWFEQTLPTLAENLALDEALLEARERGDIPDLIRFWDWSSYAIVLGANGRIAIDVNESQCERDQVPILRRGSGGGTVVLGPGCLMYSLVLGYDHHPDLRDVTRSYRFILARMADAFADEVRSEGISDLTIAGMKFSGNAQHRKSEALLHHGTILYDFDLQHIPRYLNRPEREPDYRRGRSHEEFVRNLAVDRSTIQTRLRAVWQADTWWSGDLSARITELVQEQFGQQEWIRRR